MITRQKFTICFDIDNTICNSIRRNHPEDILKVKPRKDIIKIIRELKRRKHKIVFFTRRGILKNGRKFTLQWLKKYKIPFDKLITKKPHYDIFIGDRLMTIFQSDLTANIIEAKCLFIKKNMKQKTYKKQ